MSQQEYSDNYESNLTHNQPTIDLNLRRLRPDENGYKFWLINSYMHDRQHLLQWLSECTDRDNSVVRRLVKRELRQISYRLIELYGEVRPIGLSYAPIAHRS